MLFQSFFEHINCPLLVLVLKRRMPMSEDQQGVLLVSAYVIYEQALRCYLGAPTMYYVLHTWRQQPMAEDATRRIFISPLGNCCQGPIHRPLLMMLKRQKDDFEQQKACEASLRLEVYIIQTVACPDPLNFRLFLISLYQIGLLFRLPPLPTKRWAPFFLLVKVVVVEQLKHLFSSRILSTIAFIMIIGSTQMSFKVKFKMHGYFQIVNSVVYIGIGNDNNNSS